jgi:hypothetical protein
VSIWSSSELVLLDAVEREIKVLADIPDSYTKYVVRGFIDIEMDKLVHPPVEDVEVRNYQALAKLFEASTDCRMTCFGRLIAYLLGNPPRSEFPDLPNQGWQRATTFAVAVMLQRTWPVQAVGGWLSQVDEPIAAMSALVAIRTGVLNGLVNHDLALHMVNELSSTVSRDRGGETK